MRVLDLPISKNTFLFNREVSIEEARELIAGEAADDVARGVSQVLWNKQEYLLHRANLKQAYVKLFVVQEISRLDELLSVLDYCHHTIRF